MERVATKGLLVAIGLGMVLLAPATGRGQSEAPELLPPLSPARPLPSGSAGSEELPAPDSATRDVQTLPVPLDNHGPLDRPDAFAPPIALPQPDAGAIRPRVPDAAPRETPRWPPAGGVLPLRLEDVREMAAAGLDAAVIKEIIRQRGLQNALSVDDLIWLKRHDVSNELIQELQTVAPRGWGVALGTASAGSSSLGTAPLGTTPFGTAHPYARIHYGVAPPGYRGAYGRSTYAMGLPALSGCL